jgi:hypothetical protein
MIGWMTFAKMKIFKDRLMAWGTIANLVMITCIALGYKLLPIHIMILCTVVLILTVIEIKFSIPFEQEYYYKRNPEFQKLIKQGEIDG